MTTPIERLRADKPMLEVHPGRVHVRYDDLAKLIALYDAVSASAKRGGKPDLASIAIMLVALESAA